MKKILFALCLLVSFTAFGQVDSTKIKVSVSLQVRDWLYLNFFLANSPSYENVYDSMKVKLRVAIQPSLTTVIKVDSIQQGQILKLAEMIKTERYGVIAIPYTRINSALKSSAYLTRKIDEIDADYTAQYNNRVQAELDRLRAVNQSQ